MRKEIKGLVLKKVVCLSLLAFAIFLTSCKKKLIEPLDEPTLTLLSPNGGETWEVGSTQTITWSSTGSVENVKIEYSIYNGSSWTNIDSSTENDGSYPWVVHATPSSSVRLRISEAIDGNAWNISDSIFAITPEGWVLQTVDADGIGYISIDLDGSGSPHISYKGAGLKYAYRTGSIWNIQTVDEDRRGGETAIVLSGSDRPHISYSIYENDGYGTSTGILKYAERTGSSWNIQTVDTAGGRYTSMELDDSERPHISYTGLGLKYAYWTGSSWDIQTVDAKSSYPSIALDSSGHPHIAYYNYSSKNIKYAYWTGSSWNIQTVDAGGGSSISIALDGLGRPHISYYIGYPSIDIKYAYWTGSSWNIQTVDAEGGGYTSIALDGSGRPHISYSSRGLKYAHWTGSMWNIQTVDANGRGYTSIALDASRRPHISYKSHGLGLKYAYLRK